MSAAMGFFPKGLKNEFETAVVNEPSVFEPLKFYCICNTKRKKSVLSNTVRTNHKPSAQEFIFDHDTREL